MAKEIKFAVTGDKELNAALKAFGQAFALKLERKALRQVAAPVLADAKANCPVGDSGDLKRSLKLRSMRRSRKRIGLQVATAKGWFKGDTFYGGFVFLGHMTGKRGSDNRKQVPANTALKDAYAKHQPTIEAAWVAACRGLVDDTVRDLGYLHSIATTTNWAKFRG